MGLLNGILYDENNEFTPIYKIPEEWLVSWENKCFYNGNLDLYDLKNNKLLLHSHSYFVSQRCPRSYASISMESKIISRYNIYNRFN